MKDSRRLRFTFHNALPIIVPLSGGTNINPSIRIMIDEIREGKEERTGERRGEERRGR